MTTTSIKIGERVVNDVAPKDRDIAMVFQSYALWPHRTVHENVECPSLSPDGTRVAYRMNTSWDEERRNYRGCQNRPIWIVDLKTYDLVSPPWTDSKDMEPVWVGSTVYFISDRDGVANVCHNQPAEFIADRVNGGLRSALREVAGLPHVPEDVKKKTLQQLGFAT